MLADKIKELVEEEMLVIQAFKEELFAIQTTAGTMFLYFNC